MNVKVKEIARYKKLGGQFDSKKKLGKEGVTQETLSKIMSLEAGDTKKLKGILKELSLTQDNVGECLNITGKAVSAWINSKEVDGIPPKRVRPLKIILMNRWAMLTVTPMMPIPGEEEVAKKPHTLKELFAKLNEALNFNPGVLKANQEEDYKTVNKYFLKALVEIKDIIDVKQEQMGNMNFDV